MQSEPTSSSNLILLEEIARSGRYVIHKAQRGSKFVVLKSAVRSDAMSIEMLRREYELAKHLSHPSIVKTLDFQPTTAVGPAIIMEYVEGESLDCFVARKPSQTARLKVLKELLEGVEYLHRQAIYHNDIKSSNIIVNRNGSARIIDFGLSLSDDSAYRGCFGGSRGSSAPEIMSGEGVCCCASDIYSLGKLIDMIFEGARFGRVVERCCHSDASRRYQSVSELYEALFLRKKRAMLGVTISLLLVLLALPYITKMVQQSIHQNSIDVVGEQMRLFYDRAFEAISSQNYYEFAAVGKGRYLVEYQRYRKMLTEFDASACDELFASQSATLDSLMMTKPSITTLPDSLRNAYIEQLNNIDLKWLVE